MIPLAVVAAEEFGPLIAKALIQYGPDLALEIAQLFKTGATLDQAIAACEKVKGAQQYRDEAVARKISAT